jgi:hypothetical protein
MTIFLSVNGLFDFDLTFPTEALLFLILSVIVTFTFISPISSELENRTQFIDYTLRKSTILITLGYEKLSTCIAFLLEEIEELNRQNRLLKKYVNSKFDTEVSFVQQENLKILKTLKGDLSIKSAYIFSKFQKELNTLTDAFFAKKFQS